MLLAEKLKKNDFTDSLRYRAYPDNSLYPQGKPDACVVGEKTFSTPLDMKDTTLSNGVNMKQTTSGEHFWPAALASNFSLGLITTRLFG